jgi:hypothetical protein
MDYKKSIIYEIVCNITNERYIGSTKRKLNERMQQHRELRYSSKCIIERNNYTSKILEHYSCNDKDELRKREQYWMNKLECINHAKAWSKNSKKEWLEENKEYVREWHKNQYQKNKEHRLKLGKIWEEKNKEYKKKYRKQLYEYKNTWGEKAWGHPFDNNLLKIDVRLFN